MAYPTDRILLYDRQGVSLGEIGPSDVLGRVRNEEVNGVHTLTLVTTRPLLVGYRLLTVDATGKWYEWVVDEPDEAHESGRCAIGTYKACWSMQYDLEACPGGVLWASAEEGTHDPITAGAALSIALTNSPMWRAGTCDVGTTGGASLYDGQVWDYLAKLVEVWGGEMDARIVVDSAGVVSRYVDWHARIGSANVTRRFDWGHDVTGIRRTPDPGPYYCRVVPRGGSEGTDSDGVSYSNRIGIEDETGGIPYLEDADAAADFRMSDGAGGWIYPTKTVNYALATEGDSEELLNLAQADLHNHTRPGVTYEANVVQFARAGMDVQGVALGDSVQCVDRGFGPTPLRIEGRVMAMEVNELNDADVTLTIGQLGGTLADEIRSLATSVVEGVTTRVNQIVSGGTIVYLEHLVDRLNAEINALGGYTYLVPGQGAITYDVAVTDPLIGSEATQVTQVKGGAIRIANSKQASFSGIEDWNWATLMVAGHINADLVTAAHIVTGYIGNASGNVFIDLDNGIVRLGPTTQLGESGTLQEALASIDANANDIDDVSSGVSQVSSDLQDEIAQRAADTSALTTQIGDVQAGFTLTANQLSMAIDDARRMATDFLTYENGELTLGATDSVVRQVLTNARNAFRNSAGDIAYFGLSADQVWALFIATAHITDMLRFGDFAWIARSNGNMTIKWVGA